MGWDGIHWKLLDDSRESMLDKKYMSNNVKKFLFQKTPEEKMNVKTALLLEQFMV